PRRPGPPLCPYTTLFRSSSSSAVAKPSDRQRRCVTSAGTPDFSATSNRLYLRGLPSSSASIRRLVSALSGLRPGSASSTLPPLEPRRVADHSAGWVRCQGLRHPARRIARHSARVFTDE